MSATSHRAAVVLFGSALVGCSSGASTSEPRCQQSSAIRVCSDASSVLQGVDVSIYQGTVNWSQVKAAGIAFGFARISDGTANPDTEFTANWQGMLAHGVVRGAYQYFRASVDPTAQANLVASSLQKAGGLRAGDLPVVMDIETADGQAEATIVANMRTWLAAVEAATGRTPILYSSAGTYPVTTAGFASFPLWVANYGAQCPDLPTGFSRWEFWQTSSTGTIGGIQSAVDLDEFPGTLSELVSLGGSVGNDAAAPQGGDAGRAHDSGSGADAASARGDAAPSAMTGGGDAAPQMGVGTNSDASMSAGAAMGQAGKTGAGGAASPPCIP